MSLQTEIVPYILHYKRPVTTSRGSYTDHKVWYVMIHEDSDPDNRGIGECAPLFDLSCDYDENYEKTLTRFCRKLEQTGCLNIEELRPYPSILFGLETALKDLESKKQGKTVLWDTPFSRGTEGIPINGLIWMGDFDYMFDQIKDKLDEGFRCVKLKIGGVDFEDEIKLLSYIRQHFSADEVELRVDANGAFAPLDALHKLEVLSKFDLHSIEQPIRAGQWGYMYKLTQATPLPIALDEELIGVNQFHEKQRLLETIKPQYIILKPTLHGGISGCSEWVELAEKQNIGWWITSALESNIGLNAIAQWCATFDNPLPHGLGTGSLYTNNTETLLVVKKDCLWYNPKSD